MNTRVFKPQVAGHLLGALPNVTSTTRVVHPTFGRMVVDGAVVSFASARQRMAACQELRDK